MLLNRGRAAELLERDRLDGLVAGRPENQYYLSGYWGLFNTPVGYDGSYFAVLPRREADPAALILPALEIRRLATCGGTWMPSTYAYSRPGDEPDFSDGTPHGAPYTGWPVRTPALLGPLEQQWVDTVRQLGAGMSPDAFWAVTRALRAAGLARGRIAVDDARLPGWLSACGLADLRCEYRPQLFNEIRMVKTPDEIALLGTAARINERALLAAADALRTGSTWESIETVFMTETAAQGGRGVYLLCGVGELPARKVRPGEPVMLDGLGQYRRYHGDFGRCAVVGEPGAEHRSRHRALCNGWEAAQAWLRPGVRYSEVAGAVGEAVRRSGLRDFRDPIVHGLGLEHTDDPKPYGVQPQTKADQVLQADMVVNVDMPHTEIGWGSLHMEDTVLIRADGCEFLTSNDVALRVIPDQGMNEGRTAAR